MKLLTRTKQRLIIFMAQNPTIKMLTMKTKIKVMRREMT